MSGTKVKEQWGSRLGVILAVTGSAVGLGNFLRFPGLVAEYGGVFMIPYFVSLLLIGLPLAWGEWAMGRYGGRKGYNSTPGIFRAIAGGRLLPYAGVLGVLVPVGIYMYYVWIESWCIGYAWFFLVGGLDLGSDPQAYTSFFRDYVGIASDGALFQTGWGVALTSLVVCVGLNFYLIYRGIQRGIEMFCMYAMPLLVLCALLVLARVLTLGTPDPSHPELNVLAGLGAMWNPVAPGKSVLASLANAEMWLAAAGQIFFSLSVGFGVIITYASYLHEGDDIALSSTTAVAGNEFCEVALGGLITIPAAFVFLGAAGTVGGTFGLGFNTLPLVFDAMPAGRLFGFLFFALLFLAAITSSLSMLQPAIAFLEEGLGLDRRGSVSLLGLLTLVGTLFVTYFSGGFAALDAIDFWVGTFAIFVLATIQTILFGWKMGASGLAELDRGAALRVPRFLPWLLRTLSPAYLIAIFLFWAWQSVPSRVADLVKSKPGEVNVPLVSLLFVLAIAAFFLLLISQAMRRWDRQEAAQKERI